MENTYLPPYPCSHKCNMSRQKNQCNYHNGHITLNLNSGFDLLMVVYIWKTVIKWFCTRMSCIFRYSCYWSFCFFQSHGSYLRNLSRTIKRELELQGQVIAPQSHVVGTRGHVIYVSSFNQMGFMATLAGANSVDSQQYFMKFNADIFAGSFIHHILSVQWGITAQLTCLDKC